jgi:hypothetical protein
VELSLLVELRDLNLIGDGRFETSIVLRGTQHIACDVVTVISAMRF